MKVHDSVALPEPVTLVGETVQAVLLLVKSTIPLNPLRAVIVIVEFPGLPTLTATDVGLAVTVKSSTVAEWGRHAVSGWSSQPLQLCPPELMS